MPGASGTNSQPGGTASNPFFSFLEDLGGIALDTIDELAPVWAANQLGLQSEDQLQEPTFVGFVPPGSNLTTQDVGNVPPAQRDIVSLSLNEILLIAGGAFLAIVLLQQNGG